MITATIAGHRLTVNGLLTVDSMAHFEKALALLRKSTASMVEIDLRQVESIDSASIGAMFALWMDLEKSNRQVKLAVSRAVKKVLDMAGLTTLIGSDRVSF